MLRTRLLALPASCLLFLSAAHSQQSAIATQQQAKDLPGMVAQLTESLVALRQAGDLNKASDVAKQRHDLLLQLAHSSPALALTFMLPAEAIRQFPASFAQRMESDADVSGTLTSIVEDYPDHHTLRIFLNTPSETIELLLADPMAAPLNGTPAHASGKRIDNYLLVPTEALNTTQTLGAGDVTSGGLTTTNTFGAQSTAVLLVNFFDNTSKPFTIDEVRQVVFGDVNNFELENSQNQTWLTGDVFGWFTLPTISTNTCTSNVVSFGTAAQQAAASAGVDLSRYSRFIYIFPQNACTFLGVATLGGIPSHALIVGNDRMQVIGHEMGHNLGLYHSHSLVCPNNISMGTNCQLDEYGDRFDIMGQYTASHFNAYQKERLGWLNYGSSQPISTVTTSGVYTLTPYETGPGVKALKILQSVEPSNGAKTWYYIEYRQQVGFDQGLSVYPTSTKGVLVRMGTDLVPNLSMLLNMNPSGPFDNAALAVGQTYVDSAAGLSITTKSADSNGAQVDIEFGPYGCVQKAPSVSVSPPQSAPLSAGSIQNYTITITNQETSACPLSTIILMATPPSSPAGWTTSLGSQTIGLAPGGTGTLNLAVKSPAGTPPASYAVNITAAKWPSFNYASSTTASYVVGGTPPPDFAISAPASVSLQAGSSLPINVNSTVSNGFASAIALAVTNLPLGVTGTFVPTGIAAGPGSSTLTLVASSATIPGSYSFNISASSGALVHTVLVALTITTASPSADFAISAPANASVQVGASTQLPLTSTVMNGFSSPVTFSAAGLPAGVNAGFSPSTLPAPGSGSSILTVTATSAAVAGKYSFNLTASGGTVTHKVLIPLTVTALPPPPPPPSGGYTLFSSSATPAVPYANAFWPLELGMKFMADRDGQITGVRYYKSAPNTGVHVGSLWSSTGQLLAQAMFINETSSGWQQAQFSSPIGITANTVYVISYHSSGAYSYDDNYFAMAVSNPPLSAPAGSSGNGVYSWGASSTFPATSAGGRNYWVDVVFATEANTASLASIDVTPSNPTVSSGAHQQFTATGHYSDSTTKDITLQVTWSSGTTSVASITAAGLATAVASGNSQITATSGSVTGSTTLTVSSSPPPPPPPTGGYTLFNSTSIPAVLYGNAFWPIELGMRFTADRSGLVTGVRFYKSSSNTAIHVGSLWSSSGQLMAQATFTGETANGWQQVQFSSPVTITANTIYVVSYHSGGAYSYDDNYFNVPVSNPPLTALPASSGNGVYASGPVSTFPSSSGNGRNYWVDVVFQD